MVDATAHMVDMQKVRSQLAMRWYRGLRFCFGKKKVHWHIHQQVHYPVYLYTSEFPKFQMRFRLGFLRELRRTDAAKKTKNILLVINYYELVS